MTRKDKTEPSSKTTLKRVDVVRKLHHETGLSSSESAELVSRVFDHISDALGRGEDVKLAGFGTFKLRQKASRLGRNPKTGEECLIAPRKVVTFKPSVAMRERVESALMEKVGTPSAGDSLRHTGKVQTPLSVLEEKTGRERQAFPRIDRKVWIALFEVLGSFAFAGTKFQPRKAEAFIQSVLEIKTSLDPSAVVTRKSVSSWVTLNQDRWSKWVEADVLIQRFKSNLSTLKNISNKSDIVFAMVDIAIAEDDYSVLEKSLIAHAILEWDMPANIIQDIEYVCPEIIPDLREIS